jgi:hypothetical protein
MTIQLSTVVRTDQAASVERMIEGAYAPATVTINSTAYTVNTFATNATVSTGAFVFANGLCYTVTTGGTLASSGTGPTITSGTVVSGSSTLVAAPATIQLYAGGQPVSCSAAPNGSLFATLTASSKPLFTATNGSLTLAGTVSGNATGQLLPGNSAGNTQAYFRVLDGVGYVHAQGQVGMVPSGITVSGTNSLLWQSNGTASLGASVQGISGGGAARVYQLTSLSSGTSYITNSAVGPTIVTAGATFTETAVSGGIVATWTNQFLAQTDWGLNNGAVSIGQGITIATAPSITVAGA